MDARRSERRELETKGTWLNLSQERKCTDVELSRGMKKSRLFGYINAWISNKSNRLESFTADHMLARNCVNSHFRRAVQDLEVWFQRNSHRPRTTVFSPRTTDKWWTVENRNRRRNLSFKSDDRTLWFIKIEADRMAIHRKVLADLTMFY